MTTTVELRLSADVDKATRDVGRFRKEYAELVRSVEKPLRQVNAFRGLEEQLEETQRQMRAARDRVRELGQALAAAANPSREMQAGYRDAVSELRKLERAEGALTGQIGRRRSELQAAGVDTRNLAREQARLAQSLTGALESGRSDLASSDARKALGVGAIEETQRELVRLRQQYKLVTSDGELSAKQRAEAEAAYRRSVAATLERLRDQREANRQAVSSSVQQASTLAERQEAARLGIRRVTAEQKQAAIAARQTAIEQARGDLGVNRYRALQAELGRVRGQYDLLRRSGNLTTRELALAQRNMTQRVRETQRALREMNAEQRRSGMGGAGMTGMLGPLAVGYGAIRALRGVAAISDEWVELTDRMKIATNSQQEYEHGLERLREISDRTYTSMSNNAEVFIQALSPMREQGFNDNETLQFVEAVGLGLVASAAKGERATAVINQLNGALQQGELRGDAFNTVIRNTPAIADALARGLGKTREQLAAMAKAGELTTGVWVPALLSQTDELGTAVDGMAVTVEDALVRLDNAWTQSLGESDMSPLIDAIESLTAVISDPEVMAGLITLASGLVTIAGEAVKGASEFADLGSRIGYMAANATGAVDALGKIDQQIKDIDRSLNNTGMSRTLASFWFSKEELQAQRALLDHRRKMLLQHHTGVTEEQRTELDEQSRLEEEAHRASTARHRTYVNDLRKIQDQQLDNIKDFLRKQKAEETKALREIEKIREERLKIDERYDDALNKLSRGNRPANFLDATSLRSQAQQALNAGDIEKARKLARQALDVLMELQEAGENTYGFAGVIESLRGVEHAASDLEETQAETKLEEIRASMAKVEEAAEALKDMPVSVTLDEQQMEAARAQIKALAEAMKKELVLPVTVVNPDSSVDVTDAINRLNSPPPGFSGGGWTGPGRKHQFAGYVHADEYVQPKHRMQEPGALAFMERFRKYGMKTLEGYAEGGLVSGIGRRLPHIPTITGTPPPTIGGTPLHLHLDGQQYEVQASQDVIAQLSRAARKRKLQRS